jgi:hypothetical protein
MASSSYAITIAYFGRFRAVILGCYIMTTLRAHVITASWRFIGLFRSLSGQPFHAPNINDALWYLLLFRMLCTRSPRHYLLGSFECEEILSMVIICPPTRYAYFYLASIRRPRHWRWCFQARISRLAFRFISLLRFWAAIAFAYFHWSGH